MVERICELRRQFTATGLDADPETIRWHLSVEVSVSTIRRHLVADSYGETSHLMCQIWPSPSLTSTHILSSASSNPSSTLVPLI